MPEPAGATRRRTIDPDRLARLEEERDFLLRSLDDLDRELEAGDVDRADYDELREGYVARAATVLHEIAADEAGRAAIADTPPRRGRRLLVLGGVVAFAAVAGVLLARASGFRGTGTTLTGSGATPGDRLTECRSQLGDDPAKSVACFDKLLAEQPDDPETLTYSGWARVQNRDVAGGTAQLQRVVAVDPTYPDVHVFLAAVHKNAGEFAAAQAELDRLAALNPPAIVLDVVHQMGLDTAVAEGLLSPDTRTCWTSAKTAITAAGALDPINPSTTEDDTAKQQRAQVAASLAQSLQCLDKVVAARTDATALQMRGIGLLALALTVGGEDANAVLTRARQSADSAVTAAPTDPSGHYVRAFVAAVQGDEPTAKADLAAAGDRQISPLFASLVTVSDLKKSIEGDAASALTTTTAPGG